MSRRKTVQLNLDFVRGRIKEVCRSNVVFCEAMGRGKQKTWVTGWGINKNLPSPEEAAQMCAILQVRPEDILTQPEDVELVQSLIDGQKEKADPQKEIGLDDTTKRLLAIAADGTPEEIDKIIEYAAFLRSQRDKG